MDFPRRAAGPNQGGGDPELGFHGICVRGAVANDGSRTGDRESHIAGIQHLGDAFVVHDVGAYWHEIGAVGRHSDARVVEFQLDSGRALRVFSDFPDRHLPANESFSDHLHLAGIEPRA